jgi:hypothetical protein
MVESLLVPQVEKDRLYLYSKVEEARLIVTIQPYKSTAALTLEPSTWFIGGWIRVE